MVLTVLAVLCGHALVIVGGSSDLEAWRRGGIRPLQVRQIVVTAPMERQQRDAGAGPAQPTRSPMPPPRRRMSGDPLARDLQSPASPAADPAPSDSGTDPHPFVRAPGSAEDAADASGRPPPIYPTRPAPSMQAHFELRRGPGRGEAKLEWRHDGARYELSLSGSMGGTEVLGWTSRGGFDEAGLAPERFVARRRTREVQATNFQRDTGRITFSGPSVQWPLLPGAQDRLSWLLQLAAVIEASPALGREGQSVSAPVFGTRGDAETWVFRVQAPAPLDLPEQRVEQALHLVREPTRPYDVRVEVWLDPLRHHLPLRARWTALPSGESTDLLLRALSLD
jgi:hypothetical protein